MNIVEKIKKEQLDILIEVDRICKKYNIEYQLYAGTLLGAIRHGGFIPWDDDIDIAMTRENFNKFISKSEDSLNTSYYLDKPTDSNNSLNILKVRKKGTYLYEYDYNGESELGIFIDIFPLDNSRPKSLSGNIQKIQLYLLYWLRRFMYPGVLNHRESIFKTIFKYTMFVILFPLRIFYSKKRVFNRIEKVSQRFNKFETGYICELNHGMIKGKYIRNSYNLTDIYPLGKTFFEGLKFSSPKNIDVILTQHFGDYMKLPPLSKQVPNHIYMVSFDGVNYYNEQGDLVNKEEYLKKRGRNKK